MLHLGSRDTRENTIIRLLPRTVSQRWIIGRAPHHTTPGTRGAGHPIQLHSHQVAPREMPPGGLHSLEFKPLCALTISPFGWRSHIPRPHHVPTRTDATRLDAVCPPANLYELRLLTPGSSPLSRRREEERGFKTSTLTRRTRARRHTRSSTVSWARRCV